MTPNPPQDFRRHTLSSPLCGAEKGLPVKEYKSHKTVRQRIAWDRKKGDMDEVRECLNCGAEYDKDGKIIVPSKHHGESGERKVRFTGAPRYHI